MRKWFRVMNTRGNVTALIYIYEECWILTKCLLVKHEQSPSSRAGGRVLLIRVWVLWCCIGEKPLLHIPLPPIYGLLCSWIRLYWHIRPQLLINRKGTYSSTSQFNIYIYVLLQHKMKSSLGEWWNWMFRLLLFFTVEDMHDTKLSSRLSRGASNKQVSQGQSTLVLFYLLFVY